MDKTIKNNQMEKKEVSILDFITSPSSKKQFALALPKHLSPDRFVRIAVSIVSKNPALLNCTRESLFSCLLDCSQLGLEPDGRKVHLIPYGNKCTLIVDYKGLVDLARRSGELADIHADVVGENDVFEYSYGSNSKLVHIPNLKGRGRLIAAYSFVKMKDNSISFEIMSIDEIMSIRDRSKAKNSGPWITDFCEMAKKTVFRRHSKWLPVSSELLQASFEKDYDVPYDIQPSVSTKPDVSMPEPIFVEEKTEEKNDDDSI